MRSKKEIEEFIKKGVLCSTKEEKQEFVFYCNLHGIENEKIEESINSIFHKKTFDDFCDFYLKKRVNMKVFDGIVLTAYEAKNKLEKILHKKVEIV